MTILDALDGALGGRGTDLRKLSIRDLDEIADLLEEFWTAQYEVAPTLTASRSAFVGGWIGPFFSEPMLRRDLSDALLYYPKIMVLDPLADFFSRGEGLPELWSVGYVRPDREINRVASGPAMWRNIGTYESIRSDRASAVRRFASIVDNLYLLEQPIRAGVIDVRSQWPIIKARSGQLETALQSDVGSAALQHYLSAADISGLHVWDSITGLQVSMNLPVVRRDAPMQAAPMLYYLAKTLAVADGGDAQYVPTNEASLGLLRTKYNDAVVRTHPAAMLREVARIAVPSADVALREAVAIRQSSDNFEDWRLSLQALHRTTVSDDAQTLRERVEETLLPKVHSVERELGSSSLGSSFRKAGADVVIDGAVGAATGAIAAGSVDPGAAALLGVGGAAAAGALRWLLRQYAPAPIGGDQAVLATLIKAQQKAE
ncbi:hypothetical protein DEJ17_15870 [Curtobacterium sp. MCSS17_011]|uniref:hypothetical protein n=1 Tax=Curtobacterium sp. MCSS17_011 TaxID=2175643 RepID=UPI000D9C2F6A|nr:hypothetical protein [Curtobacterium sp. MCSS17_011]PYY52600.1 hypothetical protein DEJ17_15870 [Curtobacterium sp. MCSS17_011]